MRLVADVEALKAELAAARAQIAELEVRADVDPLLDILNRRGFERELTRSLAYVKRYGTPAALLYIDLDGFKSVNDRYGHTVGDAVLKAVACALAARGAGVGRDRAPRRRRARDLAVERHRSGGYRKGAEPGANGRGG